MQTDERTRDKRTTPRYPAQLPVRFWNEAHFEGRVEMAGEVCDVSWGGMFVRSEFAPPLGTPVSLLISMPQERDPVTLRGHVAWVTDGPPKGPGMGVKLLTPL